MAQDLSKFGTKKARGTAIIRRRDGSTVYIKNSRVVAERDSKNRSVARILIQPSSKTQGIIASRPVESTRQLGISQRLQAVQEKVNLTTRGTDQEARVIGGLDRQGKLKEIQVRVNNSRTKLLIGEQKERLRQAKIISTSISPVIREQLKQLDITQLIKKLPPSVFKKKIQQDREFLKKFGEELGKKVFSGQSRGEKLKIIKEFLPVINKESLSAYKKIATGNKKNLTNSEKANILFDFATLIPVLGWFARGSVIIGKVATSGTRVVSAVNKNKKLLKKLSILNPKKLRTYASFTTSILRDVGVADRGRRSAEEFFKVDNQLLDKISTELNLKDAKQLQTSYFNEIVASFKQEKGLDWQDITSFLGINIASRKAIKNGQKRFAQELINRGYSAKKIRLIIGELENQRRSRAFGQILGLIKTEVSSEFLAQNLIKSGVRKKIGVGVAGMREGLSILAQESYMQGYELNPSDFLLAVVGGAVGSIFFSKQKLKNLRKKDVTKFINKYSTKVTNKLSPKRLNDYGIQVVRKNLKISQLEAKDLVFGLSKTDKRKLAKQVIKEGLIKSNKRKAKIPLKRAVTLWRDPIANIIDPFELVGDAIYDIQRSLSIRLNNKLRKQLSKKKKVKRIRVKAITKTKQRIALKSKIKTKPKTKTKTKTKLKTKTKTKTKLKTKTKTKTKLKTKTKTKSKTKSKIKTKTKVKTKSIRFLLPQKGRKQKKTRGIKGYNLIYKQNNKIIKTRISLPLNRAKKRLKQLLIQTKTDSGKIIISKRTKIKDIKTPDLRGFTTTRTGLKRTKKKK